jgi:putative flippase GtrA
VTHINLEVATAIGFIVGFAVSFTANRQWVFGATNQKKALRRQLAEYIGLVVFNFFFTVSAIGFLNSVGVRPAIGKLIVMAMIMCWNYALFRWVIFVSSTN